MKTKQATSKVVPFTGEFYPEAESTPAPAGLGATFVFIAAALLAGLSVGALATYQSASQQQMRQLQADHQQLQQIKTKVCKE